MYLLHGLNTHDRFFLDQCVRLASESKHLRFKVGCLITNSLGDVLASGYNRIPSRVRDLPERYERRVDGSFIEHAERIALYEACRHGTKLSGCRVYCTWFPCVDCARGLIEVGASELITDPRVMVPVEIVERWREQHAIAGLMLAESGVKVRQGDV